MILVIALLGMVGCATKQAADFGGRWRPVNHFAEAPTEIPLYTSYVYQASPMDRTLKGMLSRWAEDSNIQLVYNLPSDYTLYGPVSAIATTSLQEAAQEVSRAYVGQGVEVSVQGSKILVGPAATAAPATSGSSP